MIAWRGDVPAAWETTREPEWDKRQRSLVMAYRMWHAGLCRRCGEHLADSADLDTDPKDPEASRAWVAEVPAACFSCAALHGSEEAWAKDEQAPYLIHTTSLVEKRPRPTRR